MKCAQGLTVLRSDYEKLQKLIKTSRSEATKELQNKLFLCEICQDDSMPGEFVRLSSLTWCLDLTTGNSRAISIVMPWQSDVTRMKMSICSPIGIAMIGSSVGDTVIWPLLNKKSRLLRVIHVEA